MDRLERFGQRRDSEQVWFRGIYKAEELSPEGLPGIR